MRAWLVWIVLVVLTLGVFPSASRAADDDVVRLMFNPGLYDELPFMVALDRGYFSDEHLDVRVTKAPGSLALVVPYLARGDIDVAPQVMSPAFFNQYTEGFGIKAVAALDQAEPGWNDTVSFMVRQDLWDAGKIRKPSDLRGAKIPKPTGTPNDFLAIEIMAKGGLTMANVQMNVAIVGATTNFLPAMRNKQFDAMSVPEPIATQFDKQGVAHKWLGYKDVIPHYQTAYLAYGPAFVKNHPDDALRFMRAYLRACRDIAATNGKWTPALIDSEAKWSGLDRNAIAEIPGPAYPSDGTISPNSMERQEQLWLSLNMMQKKVPVNALIDDSFVTRARKSLGIK